MKASGRWAIAAVLLAAALPGAYARAGEALEQKTYSPAARGRTRAVVLLVTQVEVRRSLGKRAAPPGSAYAVLDLSLENVIPLRKMPKKQEQDPTAGAGGLGFGGVGEGGAKEKPGEYVMAPTPYVIMGIQDHAFLVVNGDRTAVVSEAQDAAARPLSLENVALPKLGAVVRGQLVYEVPDDGVSSLLFRFLDTAWGGLDLPLFGKAPPAAKAVAGPVENELLALSVYRLEERTDAGGARAPAGRRFAVVEVGLTGRSAENLVRVEIERYATLRDGRDTFRTATGAKAPGLLRGEVQLLPDTLQRGALVFDVAEKHGPLTLALRMPGYGPLALKLQEGADIKPAPAAAGSALVTFRDGDKLEVEVHGARYATAIGEASLEEGRRFLVLDLSLANKIDDGIDFQTGEQIHVICGAEEISFDAEATGQLPSPLAEGITLEGGSRTRYEVAFQVPAKAGKVQVRYRGFEVDEKRAIAPK